MELYKGELDKEIFDEDNNTNNIIKPFTSNGEAWQRNAECFTTGAIIVSSVGRKFYFTWYPNPLRP